MSDKQKKPDFETEVAADWYQGLTRDLEAMSPGQLRVTKKALADFEAKRVDTSEKDFNRRCARATDYELEHFRRFGEWPEKR